MDASEPFPDGLGPWQEVMNQDVQIHGYGTTQNPVYHPFSNAVSLLIGIFLLPLLMLYKPSDYSTYNDLNFDTHDSAYGTSEVNSGIGESTQPVSYPAQVQPSMGRPTQQLTGEWPNNGAKKRRLGYPGPSGVASLPPATDTDVGVPLWGGLFAGDQFKVLEDWYTASGYPDPTADEIKCFVILYKLPEDDVREWFRKKRSLNANEDSLNCETNSMTPTRQTGSFTCPPENIDPILLSPANFPRHFERRQQRMQPGQTLATRRTPVEPAQIRQTHRSDEFEDRIAYQNNIAPGNHAAEITRGTIQGARPLDLDGWSRTVINKYLAESPNRCHKSKQPKTENQTYSCTSRCGRTFKRCGDWKRHEEINQPQSFFICLSCPVAKPWIHHRKDKWEKHIKDAHADVESPLPHKVNYPKFRPRCGFCGYSFYSWKKRCDHVGQHFTGKLEKQPMEEWKDPWIDPPNKRSLHSKGPTGPPDNDHNNPDYSPGNGGTGAPPSDDRRGGYGSSSGSGSGNRSGGGGGSFQGAPHGSTSRKCALDFEQPSGSSRNDAQDLLPCPEREPGHCHYNHSSNCKDDRDNQVPRSDIQFHTLDMLGYGSHSIVEKVEHCPTGRTFARKTIRNPGKGTSTIERFRAEVDIMKRLNHPHIIQFVAQYVGNSSLHVVMSPVAEHNLKECLDHPDTLPQNHVLLRSIGCLASAVAYLHSVHVRHKDIKPQNILVKNSKVFLTDFGISKTWTDVESTTDSISAMTPMYAAPEVAAHGKHGTKADVFSLGLVFLEIIAVTNEGSMNRLRSHLNNPSDYSMTHNLAFGPAIPREPIPKPYYANIIPILKWTTSLHFPTLRPQCAAGLRVLLDLCRSMVQQDPVRRPTASELTRSVPPEFSCGSCSSCIRQNRNPGKLRLQIALLDPSPNLISPKIAPTIIHGSKNPTKAADSACDISLATLCTGAIDEWNPNCHSDFGYIIGRKPTIFGTSLQQTQDAKRMCDVLDFLEQPRLEVCVNSFVLEL